MEKEIAECLNLGIDFSDDILITKLTAFISDEGKQELIKKETGQSLEEKSKVIDFPLQDSFWCMKEVVLKCKDLLSQRFLVLMDTGAASTNSIQISVADSNSISYEDQAIELFFHGCFFPLDGRKSRRPRLLSISDYSTESDFSQECAKFGIHFCGAVPSEEEFRTLRTPSIRFRQCSVCGVTGTLDLFYNCDKCGAVLYCRNQCQEEDWIETHEEWCLQFKQFMAQETYLADLPFKFISETTRRDFDEERQKNFLQAYGVHMKGLWHMESTLALKNISFPDNQIIQTDQRKLTLKQNAEWTLVYGLEKESSVLQQPPQSSEKPLSGWFDYYLWRGFDMASPIAILLHFPMTLYYIVSQLLPKDYNAVFSRVTMSGRIDIHVIGVEKEVEMFYPFLECARLLAHLSVHLHLFGNNFQELYNRFKRHEENLHFHIHKGLYHRRDSGITPEPDVAVCFNGGIGAYTSYTKTVKYLTKRKIPFYYTDYGQASITFSRNVITRCKAGHISEAQVNPFRCPLRLVATDQNLPRYSNALITHIT